MTEPGEPMEAEPGTRRLSVQTPSGRFCIRGCCCITASVTAITLVGIAVLYWRR